MTTSHATTTVSAATRDLRHIDTRTPRGDARAAAAALRSEWIKAVTVRATGTVLALAFVGGLVVGRHVRHRPGPVRRRGGVPLDRGDGDARGGRRRPPVRVRGRARHAGE